MSTAMHAIVEHFGGLINAGNSFKPPKVRGNRAFGGPDNCVINGNLYMCPNAILSCSNIKHNTDRLLRR